MAKQEYRKPIANLIEKKNELDRKLTTVRDKQTKIHSDLTALRADEFAHREAKEALPRSNRSKPAIAVFDQQIAENRKQIEVLQKEWEQYEKERVILQEKLKAMEASIKELSNA